MKTYDLFWSPRAARSPPCSRVKQRELPSCVNHRKDQKRRLFALRPETRRYGPYCFAPCFTVRHDARISVIGPNSNDITWDVMHVLGYRRSDKTGGLRVSGCGMDMGFHVVYNLGYVLWPDGTPEPTVRVTARLIPMVAMR